jgi:hypothetical protein
MKVSEDFQRCLSLLSVIIQQYASLTVSILKQGLATGSQTRQGGGTDEASAFSVQEVVIRSYHSLSLKCVSRSSNSILYNF